MDTDNFSSISTVLPNGKESMRVDTYRNQDNLKTAEYSIHFQTDTTLKEQWKYDQFNRVVWHYVQDRFEQHIFRWQYDSTGENTQQTRYYVDGLLTETTEVTESFDAAGYYEIEITVNGKMRRSTAWMLAGKAKTDILFNAQGDTLTEVSTMLNSLGNQYMEITKDHEFGTEFTRYTFYDKHNRIIGELGIEGQNIEEPKLNWRIEYDRKGREKKFNRLSVDGKILYTELNKYDKKGFLLRKRYVNRDGRIYLEDRYKITYQ